MVEFAVVFSVAIVVIIGIIVGSFVFFQNEAVTNGARGGSRWASVEQGLYSSSTGGYTCESGQPDTIVNAVKKSANILPLNPAPLCAVSSTQLQQMPVDPTRANIVVDAQPSLAAPQCITVTVTYKTKPIAVPITQPITLQGHSTIQLLLAAGTTTTTSTSSNVSCPGASSPNYSITTGP